MKHVLNCGQAWIGRPVRGLSSGNRRPVALSDALTLTQDNPPATVIVLANDFDPENGVITVISATAIVGDVVINPDDTLSYTPLTGYIGQDTITYTIEDDQGQTHSADVFITVSAPALSIDIEADNTLTVNAELGAITVTVTEPAVFAGSYVADTGELSGGPVNLVGPVISGVPNVGEVLTVSDGLWIYDRAAGDPAQGWQWRLNGVDIAGATMANYTVQPGDFGQALVAVETLTDAFGTRTAASAAVGATFQPSDDAALLGWWDASDAATITASGVAVSSWGDKAGGPALTQAFTPQQPETGVRSLNGLNVLDFDGGRFVEAVRSFPASGDVAFHMVLEIDAVTNLYEAVLAVEATNDFQIDAGSSVGFDGRLNAAGIGALTDLTGGPYSGTQILSVVLDQTGSGTIEVFLGDTSRGATAYTTPLDQNAALHIMTNRSTNAWINGAVGEIIVTGDIANRAQYTTYLSAKWGIT